MSVLFGDDSVKEELLEENESAHEKETQNVVKKPIWQKQSKRSKNMKNKKHFKKSGKSGWAMKGAGENGSVVSNKVNTEKKEKEKEKECADSESGLSDDDDRSDDDDNDGDQGDKKVPNIIVNHFLFLNCYVF